MLELKMFGRPYIDLTLKNDTAVVETMVGAPIPATVWVNPAVGDTINVWFSMDGGVTYFEWDNGPVTSASEDLGKRLAFYSGITHIKFQATTAATATSTVGVS